MKHWFKAFMGLAVLFAIAGCGGAEVDVSKNPVTGLRIQVSGEEINYNDPFELGIDSNKTLNLTAVTTGGASNPITWVAGTPNIVTISPANNGRSVIITSATAGETTVTVTAQNGDNDVPVTKTFTVKVRSGGGDPMPVTGLAIKRNGTEITYASPFNLDLSTNNTLTLTAETTGGTPASITWTAETAGFVALSAATGATVTITSVAVGETDITVTAQNSDNTTPVTKTFTIEVSTEIERHPVTGFVITYKGTTINDGGSIEFMATEPASISVALEPAGITGTVSWASNSNAVIVTPPTGLSVTISGEGTALITVTASNNDNDTPVTKSFTVTINVIDTLPWSWSQEEQPWPGLASGGSNIFKSTDYPDVSVRAFGTNGDGSDKTAILAKTDPSGADWGGIRLGGMSGNTAPNFTGNGRLAIGLAGNTATAAGDTTSTVNGDFDLAKGPVKLTITYKDLTAYTGSDRYLLRVYVNNNGTGETTSFLGSAGTIATYRKYDSTSTDSGVVKLPNATSGTIEVVIDPSRFTEVQRPALEKAFIGLHAQNSSSAGNDNGLTITSINIERITSAGIVINPEADFFGFPTETFTLSTAEPSKAITLTGSGYTTADWYINGTKQSASGKSFTVSKGTLVHGEHTLTAVVTISGQLFSKSVKFTVTE